MKRNCLAVYRDDKGFSVSELLVVVAMIFILSGFALFYLNPYQKLYVPDEESLKIVDLLQEARQRSLTERETMRVEFNRDKRTVTLIDENNQMTPKSVSNARILRVLHWLPDGELRIGYRPADIAYDPPEPTPVPPLTFSPSVYPMSVGQSVATLRFRPFSGETGNAAVIDGGTNPLGTDGNPISATIQLWSPNKDDNDKYAVARAITVVSSTGSVRMWEFDQSISAPNKWKNSRRGTY